MFHCFPFLHLYSYPLASNLDFVLLCFPNGYKVIFPDMFMMRLRDKRVKTYDKRKRLLPLKIMPCLDRILKTPLSREKGKKAIVSLSLNNKSDAGIRCELSLSRLVFFLSRFSHHASHLITIAFRYTKENMLNIKRKKVDFLNSLSRS